MVKKYILLFFIMTILPVNCLAMTFFHMDEIGSVGGNPWGGFSIDGATYNSGTSFENGKFDYKWGKLYEKGCAKFGKIEKPIYVYYDCSQSKYKKYRDAYSPYFGDKDKRTTVKLGAGEGDCVKIYNVKNDGGLVMYFLVHQGCVVGAEVYVIMGYDKTGKFVKYVDTRQIVDKYLGKENFGMKGIFLGKYYCRGNTIVIEYVDPRISHNYKSPVGEFRFKWDEKANWFGVEQVVY